MSKIRGSGEGSEIVSEDINDSLKDIAPKGSGFCEYEVDSLQKFVQVVGYLSGIGKVLWFRGHSQRSYKLQPNLFRGKDSRTEESLRELEILLNRRFRDRSMPYSMQGRDESSERGGLQSWWRLFTMQHYATPTRLLDWSENAVTALCFAVLDCYSADGMQEGAAVWVLDPSVWNNIGNNNHQSILSVDDHDAEPYSPLPSDKQHIKPKWPIAIYGMHNSPRIAMQQGTFVVFPPGQPAPMEKLASDAKYCDRAKGCLTCLTLNPSSASLIADQLRQLGFRHSMLYPDLHGLATDLRNEVR